MTDDKPDDNSDRATPARTGPTIVGVGASAGGLEAFVRLLSALPSDTGLVFVLVQHLAPNHESMLPELLGRAAAIPIDQAHDGVHVEANHAYVIPPGTTMTITDGTLRLAARASARAPHYEVDAFLSSLAQVHGPGAVGVILSGAGSDGAHGVEAIKEMGGITFAQESDSAAHPEMPQAAVATGAVDFILPPEEIARQLQRIGQLAARAPGAAPDPTAGEPARPAEDDVATILQLLRKRSGVDFSKYRHATVIRRILRRMLLHRMDSYSEYVALLRATPGELDHIYDDLLIGVTSFFRDPEVFEELCTVGFPVLMRRRTTDTPLRVWAAGCSGGEEMYSLAIALIEFLEESKLDTPVQFFGTDLSEAAIARARTAWYPESIAKSVSSERLARFFVAERGGYRIVKSLRDLCVFSRHDVANDPPFSHLDLISCRNVLIYFEPELQRRVLPVFHYALEPHGLLVLGTAESTRAVGELFELMSKRHRIYRRRDAPARSLDLDLSDRDSARRRPLATRSTPPRSRGQGPDDQSADVAKAFDKSIVTHFAGHGVVVNEKLEIVHFRGDTSRFLAHGPGAASLDLLQLARAELLMPLRIGTQRALDTNQPVREGHIELKDGDVSRRASIDVLPLETNGHGGRLFAVLFTDEPSDATTARRATKSRRGGNKHGNDAKELAAVQDELAATRNYLTELVEEHEATIEELRSAGEEIQSSNEELQSTNEELETTKEEIQSTNEELTTLNEELRHRNRDLGDLASDLSNVLSSIKIPVVIVGSDLRLKRFTPATNRVMRVVPTDVGRPLGDIKLSFDLSDLEQLIAGSIESLSVTERVVHSNDGNWWSLTIRPYQTVDRRVDGAVLVFSDVDTAKRAEQSAEAASERRRQALVVAEEGRLVALARANEALAAGMAERQRAEIERNALLRRLDSAQEDERRHLSRDLHDEVGQHLTAMGLGLQALSDVAPPGSEVDRRAEELRGLADILSRELHGIALRLRPKALDDFGLEAALDAYVRDWSAQTKIPAEFHAPSSATRLPPSIENAAYRIVQEALTNVAKHSGAERVSVVVERRDNQLRAVVEDNGKGFNPEVVLRGSMDSGKLGLLGIRERVALLGGTMEIESAPDGGTTIFVRLPIEVPVESAGASESVEASRGQD